MQGAPKRARRGGRSRTLSRRLALVVIVYFFAGGASQKLVPGVDEVFPFFGWSLFSKVPNAVDHYTVLLLEHDGRRFDPPLGFLEAPESVVRGNRAIGGKVIQKLGRERERGQGPELRRLRRLFEESYLAPGSVRYELVFERYRPLDKWRGGDALERRTLATFTRRTPGGER